MSQIIGYAVGAMLTLLALFLYGPMIHRAGLEPLYIQAAYHHEDFTNEVKSFVSANFTVIEAKAASGVYAVTPAIIASGDPAVPALVTNPSFARFTDGNLVGQNYVALIRRPAASQLRVAVVACGGDTLRDSDTLLMSRYAGPYAGVILADDPAVANQIVSATGTWPAEMRASFASAACPLTGTRLASVVFFDDGQQISPYLHRYAVPGAGAEPQTMHSDLLMGGATPTYSITNVSNLTATTVDATNLKGQKLTIGSQEIGEDEVKTLKELHGGTINRDVTVNGSVSAGGFFYK